MDGSDRGRRRWASLRQWLRLNRMCCCGATWTPSQSALTMMETLREPDEGENRTEPEALVGPVPVTGHPPPVNLAMALAAERNNVPTVKSLMMLIEESNGDDWTNGGDYRGMDTKSDWLCCVCMERSKGAAFIPCGHTYCRACSREMWVNRGMCPICNRPILQILDIY